MNREASVVGSEWHHAEGAEGEEGSISVSPGRGIPCPLEAKVMMTVVATFVKVEDAYLARSRLEGSGIEAHLRDDGVVSIDWFLSNALGGVKVVVKDQDVLRAREILGHGAIDDGILYCSSCGSGAVRIREMGVITGLFFFLGLPLPIRSKTLDCRDCGRSSSLGDCLKAGRARMSGAGGGGENPDSGDASGQDR